MAPIKSATNAKSAAKATRTAISLAGLLALIASIFVLVAAPASAGPTAGSRAVASGQVILKVAPQSSGTAPALKFSFATNNASRCPAGAARWIYANNNQLSWTLNTQHDPTPTAITSPNSDQTICTYTVTISSNLQSCSYSINRGVGSTTTASSFTLTGSFVGEFPNYSTGKGEFADIGSNKTITITPSGCTAPPAPPTSFFVQVRSLEESVRYRVNFSPFGTCNSAVGSNIADGRNSVQVFASLDFTCNWQVSATPIEAYAAGGCVVDSIVYHTDGTTSQSRGGVVLLHKLGNFPAHNSKRVAQIHLMASTELAGSGVCEESARLTLRVDLPTNLSASSHRDETVSFTIAPYNSTQSKQCSQSMTVTATNRQPKSVDLVRSPAGTTVACLYSVTAAAVAGSLRLAPTQNASRLFDPRSTTQGTLAFSYVVNRLPVRISTQIFTQTGSVFTTNDLITLLVSVPGACGNDTTLFGGVLAIRGVSYGVVVSPGVTTVIGAGARTINPAASYTLPPYLTVNSVRTPCAVRVTQASTYPGCVMRNALRDASGQPYQEVAWTSASTAFNLTVQYDCREAQGIPPGAPGSRANITLPRGWVMLPFNGATGTSPASFRRSLGNAFSSLWVWDASSQSWLGWSPSSSSSGLTRLTQGDVVFAYVPSARSVSYSPSSLLEPTSSRGSRSVGSGYSLLAFAGTSSTSLSSLLNSQAANIRLVFRWNNASQSWSYFIPAGRPIVTTAEWFDTINPGDTVFVLNRSRSSVTIQWP